MRGGSLLKRRAGVLAFTFFAYLLMRFDIKVGGFVPKVYKRQVVENSDFRKYDDGLRMILDCTVELERALSDRLAAAARDGIVRYGLYRQDAAMMTCFTPSALRSDHVHFIDGARGGYASAATALKAMSRYGAGLSGPARVQVSPPQSAPTQPSTRSVSAPVTAMLLA